MTTLADVIAKNRKAARTIARLRASRKLHHTEKAKQAEVLKLYGLQTEAEMSVNEPLEIYQTSLRVSKGE